jgi:hypothetical protein
VDDLRKKALDMIREQQDKRQAAGRLCKRYCLIGLVGFVFGFGVGIAVPYQIKAVPTQPVTGH